MVTLSKLRAPGLDNSTLHVEASTGVAVSFNSLDSASIIDDNVI